MSSYMTSYIPTTTAQVTRSVDVSSSASATRNADSVSMTGTNFSGWYNQSEGSFVVESSSPCAGSAALGVIGVGDNTKTFGSGDMIYLANSVGLSFKAAFNIYDNGSQVVPALTAATVPTAYSFYVTAISYIENNSIICNDGTLSSPDTSCTIPTVTGMSIGSLASAWLNATNYLNGHIKSVTYYPKRLTDAELIGLTS